MIIRGIRTVSRVQLYGMDYRTDTQFERYDSSGWSYSAQEQSLIVKMKHRSSDEVIRVILREAPRPAPPPQPVIEERRESETAATPAASAFSAAPFYPAAPAYNFEPPYPAAPAAASGETLDY
jgi:hypothetical protein